MHILHLDSSVLGAASVSRQLSADIVTRQRELHPRSTVAYRDLAADPVPHLTGGHLAARMGAASDDPVLDADLDALLAADVLVIGAPMYNFSIPSTLKAWIDRIAVAGKTFRYTAAGPEGLLENKKAFIASTRGSQYQPGSPSAALEHQESYLIGLLAFLGVTDVEVIRAEGIALGPDARESAVARARERIAAMTDTGA